MSVSQFHQLSPVVFICFMYHYPGMIIPHDMLFSLPNIATSVSPSRGATVMKSTHRNCVPSVVNFIHAHSATCTRSLPEHLRERERWTFEAVVSQCVPVGTKARCNPNKFCNSLWLLAESLAVQHQLTGLSSVYIYPLTCSGHLCSADTILMLTGVWLGLPEDIYFFSTILRG